jgi:hypothetical protein
MKGSVRAVPLLTPQEVIDAAKAGRPVEYICNIYCADKRTYDDTRSWPVYAQYTTSDKFNSEHIAGMMKEYSTLYRTWERTPDDVDALQKEVRRLEDRTFVFWWAMIILLAVVIFEPVVLQLSGSCS